MSESIIDIDGINAWRKQFKLRFILTIRHSSRRTEILTGL